MPMNDIPSLIAQVGFPMAVAIYMLGRTDKRLDALTQSLQELTGLIRESVGADRRTTPKRIADDE